MPIFKLVLIFRKQWCTSLNDALLWIKYFSNNSILATLFIFVTMLCKNEKPRFFNVKEIATQVKGSNIINDVFIFPTWFEIFVCFYLVKKTSRGCVIKHWVWSNKGIFDCHCRLTMHITKMNLRAMKEYSFPFCWHRRESLRWLIASLW